MKPSERILSEDARSYPTGNTPDEISNDGWNALDVLIIAEGLVGLQAQALGLAERAGLATDIRVLRPHGLWSRLPARFWPDPIEVVAPDAADVPFRIIGCGGVAAAVGARLKKSGRQVVHVQHPRMNPAMFDLVIVNRHDQLAGPNVIATRTALHRVTQARLAAARETWRATFAHLPRPLVCVLIGGSNGRFRLDLAVGQALAAQLAAMMRLDRIGLALTSSRRTLPEVTSAFREALEPLGGWVWDGSGDNPYFGLLASADALIVTMDSVSMVSEAAATTVPVMVAPLPGRSRRIARFTEGLLAERRIRLYAGRCESWATSALDDTDMAATEMRDRLGW